MNREESIEKSVSNAAASVEIEGYQVDKDCRDWCKKVLLGEMSKEDYYRRLLIKAGVATT